MSKVKSKPARKRRFRVYDNAGNPHVIRGETWYQAKERCDELFPPAPSPAAPVPDHPPPAPPAPPRRAPDTFEIRYHSLKSMSDYFGDIAAAEESIDVRRFDRDYRPGDLVVLREYNALKGRCYGKTCVRRIKAVVEPRDLPNPEALATGFAILILDRDYPMESLLAERVDLGKL